MAGKLVVIEGGDGAGKTTQARMLVEALNATGAPAVYLKWPDRATGTGKIVNQWLTGKVKLAKHATNLLFLANLWELDEQIKSEKNGGKLVVVDRYSASNIVYSMSMGCSREETEKPTEGLTRPDLVLLFDIDPKECLSRKPKDEELEVTETVDVQQKIRKLYHSLKNDKSWVVVDANRSIDQVHDDVLTFAKKLF